MQDSRVPCGKDIYTFLLTVATGALQNSDLHGLTFIEELWCHPAVAKLCFDVHSCKDVFACDLQELHPYESIHYHKQTLALVLKLQ